MSLKFVKINISTLSSIVVKMIKKFQPNTSGEVFCFKITNRFQLFSSQSGRLHKQVSENEINGYKLNEKLKLTIEIYTNLSYINISYYSKLGIMKVHVEFCRRLSKNHSIFDTLNDRRNPLCYSYL